MLTVITPLLAALLFPGGLTFPYPFLNTTTSSNITNSNTTASSNTTDSNPSTNGTVEYNCEYRYPSDVTVLNQRYPDYNSSHLHEASTFIMLRREVDDAGEIASRVQFHNLPSDVSNTICRLEFVLPKLELQRMSGFNPSFNVYQVERDVDAVATWNTYEGNNGAVLFGQVNGEPDALERTRSVGGVAAINETGCKDTLTFQMGMAYNSRNGVPNFWDFSQVSPPAWPEQGFRIVWGC
jgi:hypothetical protein